MKNSAIVPALVLLLSSHLFSADVRFERVDNGNNQLAATNARCNIADQCTPANTDNQVNDPPTGVNVGTTYSSALSYLPCAIAPPGADCEFEGLADVEASSPIAPSAITYAPQVTAAGLCGTLFYGTDVATCPCALQTGSQAAGNFAATGDFQALDSGTLYTGLDVITTAQGTGAAGGNFQVTAGGSSLNGNAGGGGGYQVTGTVVDESTFYGFYTINEWWPGPINEVIIGEESVEEDDTLTLTTVGAINCTGAPVLATTSLGAYMYGEQ